MRNPPSCLRVCPALLVLAASCTGVIQAEHAPPDHSSPSRERGRPAPAGAGGAAPSGPAAAQAGTWPLERLTRERYINTVRDLLGGAAVPAAALPSDVSGSAGFAGGRLANGEVVGGYMKTAQAVGALVATSPQIAHACDAAAMGDEACAAAFVAGFGRRAFRRALTEAERTRYLGLYRAGRGDIGHDHGRALGLVVEAMLQSPKFLYLWERGPRPLTLEKGLARLSADEIASRLSYFLWNTMPDAELFQAADTGRLLTAAGLEAEVGRMLKSPRLRASLASFHVQWLELSHLPETAKDPARHPGYGPALTADMLEEVARFTDAVIRTGDGTLAALFSSPVVQVTPRLGALYGIEVKGDWQEVTLDPARRPGLLTRPAFLAQHATAGNSHPIKRGMMVFQRVMCGELPPPPMDVPEPETPGPNLSTRQVFEMHAANPCATACHGFIDPPGFAFENYDAVGAWRDRDGGSPVDASGKARLPGGGSLAFRNPQDLMQQLAQSDDVRRCYLRQWTRFLLGRAEGADDEGWMEKVFDRFAQSRFDIRVLFGAMATSDAFRFRKPQAGEK